MLQQSKICQDENIVGKGAKFQRIRRITGYLVGYIERFNDAKKRELGDRVVHMGRNFGKAQTKI